MGPQITVCPCLVFFFQSSSVHPYALVETTHQWLFSDLVALKPLTPGALLHYNQESNAGAWDPSSLGKVVVCSVITVANCVITSCQGITRLTKH